MPTLIEAAKALDLAPSTLRHQVRNRKLRAWKFGGHWYISEDEIDRYRRENRQPVKDVPA